MKRFIIFLTVVLCSLVCNAQIQYYRSTGFAFRNIPGTWSDWQDSNVLITFNLDTDIIQIYSPEHQKFRVTDYSDSYTDSTGGRQIKFTCIDLIDSIKCDIRLRIETNGNSQVYVDYANISYVYNVKRTN